MAGSAIDHQPKGPRRLSIGLKGGRHAMTVKTECVPLCGAVSDAMGELKSQPYDVVTVGVGRPIVRQVAINHFETTVCNVSHWRQRLALFDCKGGRNVNASR